MEPPPDNLEPPPHRNPADNYPLNKNGFWNRNQSTVSIAPPAPGGGAAKRKSKSRKKCPEGEDPPRGFTGNPRFRAPRFVVTLGNDPRGWVWDEDGNRFEEHQIPAAALPVYKCSYCMESFKGSGALSEHLKSHSQEGPRDFKDLVAEYAERSSADNSGTSDSDDEEVQVSASESPGSEADSEEPQNEDDDEDYTPERETRRGLRRGSGSTRRVQKSGNGPPPQNGDGDSTPGSVSAGRTTGRNRRTGFTSRKGHSLAGSSMASRVVSKPGNPMAMSQAGIDEYVETVDGNAGGEPKVRCKLCGLVFSTRQNTRRHIKVVHLNQRPHKCPICLKAFSRKSVMEIHLKGPAHTSGSKQYHHHRVRTSRNGQPQNGKGDSQPERVAGKAVGGNGRFGPTNGKGPTLTGSLRASRVVSKPGTTPQAIAKAPNSQLQGISNDDDDDDGMNLFKQAKVDSAIGAHSEPEPAEPKTSKGESVPGNTRTGLRRRATTRTGDKSGSPVPRGNPGMDENIQVVQSKGKRKSKCKLCGMIFGKRWRAVRHIKEIHLKEKPHRCPKCPEAFFRKQGLQRHLDNHSRSKPTPKPKPQKYKCSVCSKEFSLKITLAAHLRSHRQNQSESRPYRCRICSMGYWRSDHLKRHLLVHSGTRPHKCNLCEKAFFRRYELTDHLRNTHNTT